MKVVLVDLNASAGSAILTGKDLPQQKVGMPRQFKEIQISLITCGEGVISIGEYVVPFKPGNIFIIGCNQSHVFRSHSANQAGTENVFSAIHLHFDFKRIPETFFLLHELGAIRKFISSCATGLQLPVAYEPGAAMLIKSTNEKTNLEKLLGLFEIFHFFSNINTDWKPLSGKINNYTIPKTEGRRMKDVFKYTLDNYAENITLHKIASIAHITPHAFCKYFKQHTRKTYNNFLNEVRVNEACKKIISGSYDGLSTIAYKTGFKGASNFNRVFKKTTGMSPSDYKKEFRKSFL